MAVGALLHYALEVPDQTVGEKFYRSFGLVGDGGRDGAVHLRPASVGRESVRMQEAGWQPGWGLGRHVIGSNFFYYTRDPWGSFAEYFHALYRCGPPVPDDFGLNREVEG